MSQPIHFTNTTFLPIDNGGEEIHAAFTQIIPDEEILGGEHALGTKEKLIELASQEWKKWGELRAIVERQNGRHCLLDLSQKDTEGKSPCVPDEKLHRNFDIPEPLPYSEEECQIIARYWRAVGREFNCQEINEPKWPWSAAFISWLFVKAGFTVDQFRPSEGHARYIVEARDQLLAAGILKAEPTPGLPSKGELICSVRGKDKSITAMYQIEAAKTLSHCDIVVEVDVNKKIIEVIGGNVHGVVARTTIELDDSGQLNAATNTKRPWLVRLRHKELV